MFLYVFAEGREIIDVDTKETLGKTENLIEIIKISRVTPKVSYAKLTKGDLMKIAEGLVCRVRKTKAKTAEGLKGNIERDPKGGVKLPFDN